MIYELIVEVPNASELARTDNEAFAMVRRRGFGASDSSVLLNVNPFPDGTMEKLLEQKRSRFITAEEMAIGQNVNVRKGADLEYLILDKFIKKFNVAPQLINKPSEMFRIGGTALTVNYDAIMEVKPFRIPVECKYVSPYAGKYYNFTKSIRDVLKMEGTLANLGTEVNNLYLNKRAEEAGIPIYYYTQIQQQMMGLNAPFAYLTVLVDKTWEIETFLVQADPQVHQKLLEVSTKAWELV